MKCPLCNARKGKRLCPALGKEICPQCCGEKRVSEIPCPADCSYLAPGLENEWIRTFSGFTEWVGNPSEAQRYLDTFQHLFVFVRTLEMELVRHTRRYSAFTDAEVLETVELALKDYRTEEKGILFSHSSTNPAVQRLLRSFLESIERIRADAEKEMTRLPAGAIAASLDFIHAQIRYLMSRSEDKERAYLDFISRQFPPSYFKDEPEPGSDEPGRIILASR